MLSWLFSRNKTTLPKNYRSLIDPEAIKIVERLQKAGYETYLVGGCVRDILLGKKPKDFDISTNATPQKVKSLIPRSFIIGKRFRIVVAKRPNAPLGKTHADSLFPEIPLKRSEKEFQITTFRREPVMVDGKMNENVFGTAAEDAARRDFTINALFLDPRHGKILDFLGGMDDLSKKRLRIIGEANHRFREDPIRIFRALRFMARAHLKLEKSTEQALRHCIPHLGESKRERVREEFLKVFREGAADVVWQEVFSLHLLSALSKPLKDYFEDTRRRQEFLSACKSINNNPWPQSNQTPFFYILLRDLLRHRGKAIHHNADTIFEELKVFKVEREEMDRVDQALQKIERDPTAESAPRLLGRNFRHYPSLAQTFYVLNVLADAGIANYADLWKTWKPAWQDFLSKGQSGAEATFRRAPQSRGGRGRRRGGRSRSRSAGGTSTAATGSSSTAPSRGSSAPEGSST